MRADNPQILVWIVSPSATSSIISPMGRGYGFASYVLLNPFRGLVSVYLPFESTEAFSQLPLHSAVGSRFAIIFSSVLISFGLPNPRCPCQLFPSPGE